MLIHADGTGHHLPDLVHLPTKNLFRMEKKLKERALNFYVKEGCTPNEIMEKKLESMYHNTSCGHLVCSI